MVWYHILFELGHFTLDLMLIKQKNTWKSAIFESVFFFFAKSCITEPQAFYKILVCFAFIGVLLHRNFVYVANEFNNNHDYYHELFHFGVGFLFQVLSSDSEWYKVAVVSFILSVLHIAWEGDSHPNQPIRLVIVAFLLVRLLYFWSFDYRIADYLFA